LISGGIGNTVGAPSFAFLAKGGNHERLGRGVHPGNHRNGVGGIAAHPCKERKDGAPSPWIVRTEIKSKGSATPANTSVLFTAHIDTSFAYNPIGALIHLIRDVLHIGGPRKPC
jgi:hypothetical protein